MSIQIQIDSLRGDVDAVLKTKGALKLIYFRLEFDGQVRGPSTLGNAIGYVVFANIYYSHVKY